jgi:hypothetical protein
MAPTTNSARRNMSAEALKELAVNQVSEVQQIEGRRTELLRELGKTVVCLRGKFLYKDMPDWAGKSPEYKQAIAEVYEAAGIPEDSRDGFQTALRYHIGEELRKQLTPEQLTNAGLRIEPRSQRQQERQGVTESANEVQRAARALTNSDVSEERVEAATHTVQALAQGDPTAVIEAATDLIHQAAQMEVTEENMTTLTLALTTAMHELRAYTQAVTMRVAQIAAEVEAEETAGAAA